MKTAQVRELLFLNESRLNSWIGILSSRPAIQEVGDIHSCKNWTARYPRPTVEEVPDEDDPGLCASSTQGTYANATSRLSLASIYDSGGLLPSFASPASSAAPAQTRKGSELCTEEEEE